MSDVGRNDPCACGSGKKFKKCCLAMAESQRAAAQGDARTSAWDKLISFALSDEFERDHEIARLLFWGDLDERLDEEIERVFSLEQSEARYLGWFALDLDIDAGRAPVDFFLECEGDRLSAEERDYLERLRETYVGLYEVEEVKLDEGLRLVDLWTGAGLWVRERRATSQLVRWDILAARLLEETPGEYVIDGETYLYPVMAKERIMGVLRRRHRSFPRRFPDADARAFFKRAGFEFNRFWLDYVIFPPMPKLVTVEGDEMIFAKAVFDVPDRKALKAALNGHPELRAGEEGSWSWREEMPDDLHRSLGVFKLEKGRLALETTSKERAERGRRLLEAAAGETVRHRVTRYEDVAQAMKRHSGSARREEDSKLPPEVEAELVLGSYDRHYRKWPDQPIPALGNRTPRHAARLKTVRPKLVELLKSFDNMAERARLDGRPAHDFAWIWRELGVERPGEG